MKIFVPDIHKIKKKKKKNFKMAELEGYEILAESLARNGLKYMFGVVGIPVVEIAIAAQRCGIHYIGKYIIK